MHSCDPQSLGVQVANGIARLDAPVHCPPTGACRTWLVSLTPSPTMLAALWSLLDDAERTRARAFRVDWARNQFVQVRGMLRLLLGQCLAVPANDVGFVYGRYGKPALAPPCHLHFNVAHSGDYALLGIANGVELGVDIERLSGFRDLASLSARVLSPAEAAQWHCLSDRDRVQAFFAVWTAKEAVAKAMGQGLQLDFPALDIGLVPCGQMISVHAAGCAGHCRLMMLPAPAGYAGALATREPGVRNPAGC